MMDSTIQPYSSPENQEEERKVLAFLCGSSSGPVLFLDGFHKSQHKTHSVGKGLGMNCKVPFHRYESNFRNKGPKTKFNNKRCFHCSYHSGNSLDFKSSVPEIGMKTKYISLILNVNATLCNTAEDTAPNVKKSHALRTLYTITGL